jgi:drug/metabolite transporter (DMT)-like permease
MLLMMTTIAVAAEELKLNTVTKSTSLGKRADLNKTLAVLVLLNALWGASWVPYKVALEQLPVPVYAALRVLLVGLVLLPFALRDLRKHLKAGGAKPGLKNLPRLLLLALVGVVLNNLLVFNGAQLATATDASLLAITETLFTALLAWIFLKERFPLLKLAGLLTGAFGVYLLVAKGLYLPKIGNGGAMLGDLLLLGGFGFEALYTLLAASSVRRFPPLVVIVGTNLTALLFWGPAAAFTLAQANWQLPTIDWAGLASITYLVLVCGAVGYSIWFKALRRAEPGLISITLFIQPLVGVAIGALLLNEQLSLMTLLGGGLVVASLALIMTGATSHAHSEGTNELGSHGGAAYAEIALSEPERQRLGRALSEALALDEESE